MIEDKEIYILAKKFFEKEYGDEKIKIHSECIIDLATKAAPYFDLDEDIFIIAGWIHDMGRKIDKDTHPQKSLLFLEKFLISNPQFNDKKEIISDCILNHGRKKIPKTKYGKIMQLCDSASIRHKKWIAFAKELEGKK